MLRYTTLFVLLNLILRLVTNHGLSGSMHTRGQCKQNSYSATDNSSADQKLPILQEAESSFQY
jgi:hypothetical protein